jgi:hypothetical protein
MSNSFFRQRAAVQATVAKERRTSEEEARKPFMVVIGSLQVAVKVCVGKPAFQTAEGEKARTSENLLIVGVAMSNATSAAKMNYDGWAREPMPIGSSFASITDDLGNTCKRVPPSRGLEKWVGQVDGPEHIEAGKTLTDVLIFSLPNNKAQKLMLDLPRTNLGGKGALRIEVPMWRVEGAEPSADAARK